MQCSTRFEASTEVNKWYWYNASLTNLHCWYQFLRIAQWHMQGLCNHSTWQWNAAAL